MSIIGALLSGGVLVGKICQAIKGRQNTVSLKNGSTIIDPDLKVCGTKIISSDDNPEHVPHTYVANMNSMEVDVSMANDGDKVGITLPIQAGAKIMIDDYISEEVPPDTKIQIAPVGDGSPQKSTDLDPVPALKILARNIKISRGDVTVSVGSIKLAITTSGLIITTGATILGKLLFTAMRTTSGMEFETMDPLDPTMPDPFGENGANGHIFIYNLPESLIRLKLGDTVEECQIWLAADDKSNFYLENVRKCEPLTEAEREYFIANGDMRL